MHMRAGDSGGGPEVQGIRERYLCAISGDGKAMAAGNSALGRCCWTCVLLFHQFQESLKVLDTVDDVTRPGAFVGCIEPGNKVGDLYHGDSRMTDTICK